MHANRSFCPDWCEVVHATKDTSCRKFGKCLTRTNWPNMFYHFSTCIQILKFQGAAASSGSRPCPGFTLGRKLRRSAAVLRRSCSEVRLELPWWHHLKLTPLKITKDIAIAKASMQDASTSQDKYLGETLKKHGWFGFDLLLRCSPGLSTLDKLHKP